MATKLDNSTAKQLKAMGINAKTEEDARKKLLAILEKEGIEGMEDETLEALIDMVEGFTEDAEVEEPETDDEELDEGDADADALADEVEAEDAEADDTEEEDDEVDDEVDDEEPKPAKKTPAPKAKAKSEKKAEKPAKKEKAEKKVGKRGTKLNPKANPDDRKAFEVFHELFDSEQHEYAWVAGNGVTIKRIGKNGKRGLILFENATEHADGSITGNLYLTTMTKQTDKLDEMGVDYQLCWSGAPMIKNITLTDTMELLNKLYEVISDFADKTDKRLGENRKKMEENLKNSGKKADKAEEPKAEKSAKKATKKAKK